MDLRFFLLVFGICTAVPALGLWLYFWAYKRHINKALADPPSPPHPMAAPGTVAAFLPAAVLLLVIAFFGLDMIFDITNRRLTTADEVLASARTGYEDYQYALDYTDQIAAVLVYSEDKADSHYRLFLNQNTNDPDYAFRRGGSHTSIDRGVLLLSRADTFVLLSMNALRIAEIRCDNGTIYQLDPDSPFALIIPDAGTLPQVSDSQETSYTDPSGIKVYDEYGNLIDLTGLDWFEHRTIN